MSTNVYNFVNKLHNFDSFTCMKNCVSLLDLAKTTFEKNLDDNQYIHRSILYVSHKVKGMNWKNEYNLIIEQIGGINKQPDKFKKIWGWYKGLPISIEILYGKNGNAKGYMMIIS
jgi:hypothetical protein